MKNKTIYMVEVYSIARVYNLNFSYIFNRYFDLIYPHGFDGSSETMGQMVSFSIFIIFVSPVDISCFGINSILHDHLTLPKYIKFKISPEKIIIRKQIF